MSVSAVNVEEIHDEHPEFAVAYSLEVGDRPIYPGHARERRLGTLEFRGAVDEARR